MSVVMGPCLPPSLKLRRPTNPAPTKPWRSRVAGTTSQRHWKSCSPRFLAPGADHLFVIGGAAGQDVAPHPRQIVEQASRMTALGNRFQHVGFTDKRAKLGLQIRC